MSDWHQTACILCECNCGIEVKLEGRRLSKIRGDKAHPASRGYACEKAQRLDHYQNGVDRVLWPQRRRPDGTFETIDWDTAFREVAERLGAVRDTHGGDAVFYYGGGGQGNHLPGVYGQSTRRVLGVRYRSNALAQEKTGEFWVSARMLGAYTRADFERCEVALFIGKNPWHSHSIPRARVTLKEISADPERTLVVIDPRRSETAALADVHLRVRPGCDAWLLAALDAIVVQEGLVDEAFAAAHCDGLAEVRAALTELSVPDLADRAGVPEAQLREVARRIASAASVATFEDLGVQMNRHSTLVSYLHKLLFLLTGHFGKPGTAYVPTMFANLAGDARATAAGERRTPVTGARIIGGLVPCNAIADEILTDHPRRYRAMLVESANPAHSLADSQRMRAALRALDTLVVVDVAMTETARLADYVLPAATQYEKAEATFFNLEFPHNTFQLRQPLLAPPDGPLPEAEIHARLCEALGGFTEADLAPLHAAAAQGPDAYAMAFLTHVFPNPRLAALAPVLLYRTFGPTLPEGMAQGAVLWGAALQLAMKHPSSLAAAGFDGPPPVAAGKLFSALLGHRSGVVFAVDEWPVCFERVETPNGRIQLALPDLLEGVTALAAEDAGERPPDFPFVLSAGERRAFTANTILRDPRWRRKDPDGALRMSPADAADLGVATGDEVRLTTRRGAAVVPVEVTDDMQPGHVSLPNGLGIGAGVAPNELTALEDQDPYAGTPWHKHVPARVEPLTTGG